MRDTLQERDEKAKRAEGQQQQPRHAIITSCVSCQVPKEGRNKIFNNGNGQSYTHHSLSLLVSNPSLPKKEKILLLIFGTDLHQQEKCVERQDGLYSSDGVGLRQEIGQTHGRGYVGDHVARQEQ